MRYLPPHRESGARAGLGLGDAGILPADPLTQSAADLIAWLASNSCTQAAVAQVTTFQTAWNTANLGPALTVDGKYGPLTRGALQAVMNAEGKGTAPSDCFTPTAVVPAAIPIAVPAIVPPTAIQAPTRPFNWGQFLLITAVVAGVGTVGYNYWHKHHR
jgi:hypothetical protein